MCVQMSDHEVGVFSLCENSGAGNLSVPTDGMWQRALSDSNMTQATATAQAATWWIYHFSYIWNFDLFHAIE